MAKVKWLIKFVAVYTQHNLVIYYRLNEKKNVRRFPFVRREGINKKNSLTLSSSLKHVNSILSNFYSLVPSKYRHSFTTKTIEFKKYVKSHKNFTLRLLHSQVRNGLNIRRLENHKF